MASERTASGVTDPASHDGEGPVTEGSPLVNTEVQEEAAAPEAPANAANTEAVVAKAIAEERAKQLDREVDKQTSTVTTFICLVLVWCVFLGVLLLFAFSPVNRDVSIAVFVVGILTGLIGMASVCFKSRGGTIAYVVLLVALAIFIVVMWLYYIFVLYKASLAAVDAASNKLNKWVEDQTNGILPQLPGGLEDAKDFLDNKEQLDKLLSENKNLLEDKERLNRLLGENKDFGEKAGLVNAKSDSMDDVADSLEACQKGLKDKGAKYMDNVMTVFFAMSAFGQMCNYSHHNILQFKKWKYDCWKDCAFDVLAVNHNLKLDDKEDIEVIGNWVTTVSKLPPEQAAFCMADSLSTACVVENENFLYIMVGIVCLFLLCACCTCLCCTPASMSFAIKYSKALKKRNEAKEEAEKAGEVPEP